MEDFLNYIENEKQRYQDELFDFLKIPSISSSSAHQKDMRECSVWVSDKLKDAGIDDVRIIPTEGHPIVFGQLFSKHSSAPTVLIYGHYDVQPVDPLELWDTDPFDPVIKDGKVYARGSSDDKGQVYTHIKAVEAILNKKGTLPVNIKFLIEGEEEAGSSHLDTFIEENTDLLACDTVLISDTEWFSDGLPSICYGLRGISFVEVTVTGPNRDLHSGTFGGAVDNPINVLCSMVNKLKDEFGRITIPGFYDDVLELTDNERKGFLELPYDEEAYKKDLDVDALNGEYGYSTLERVWGRPSLDLNGIKGGYIGEGAKTVLPSIASAKISMRLVPHQDPDDITEKICKYLEWLAPATVKVKVDALHGGSPVLVTKKSAGVRAAQFALKKAFGMDPVFMREGGSIPIVETFQSVLKAPSVLLGLGLPGDNIHSPNESFSMDNYFGGIKASAVFLWEYGKSK